MNPILIFSIWFHCISFHLKLYFLKFDIILKWTSNYDPQSIIIVQHKWWEVNQSDLGSIKASIQASSHEILVRF